MARTKPEPALVLDSPEPVPQEIVEETPYRSDRNKMLPWRFTLDDVEDQARRGLTYGQIAGLMGMSDAAFAQRRKKYPEIEEAFLCGRSKGISKVAETLYEAAISGEDMASTRFYLEKRGGWKDTPAAGTINITQNNVKIDKVEVIMQMQALIAKDVPVDQWPAEVRAIAGLESETGE